MRKPESTPAWLRPIVAALEAVEDMKATPAWLEAEWPQWVVNVGRELAQSLYPTARLVPGKVWHVKEVAAILGQQVAYLHYLNETVTITDEQYEEFLAKLEDLAGERFAADVRETGRVFAEDYIPSFYQILTMALTAAIHQSHVEMNEFMSVFSRALAQKPTEEGVGRTTTMVYIVMMERWMEIEKLGSIRALHDFLCKHPRLGAQVVGEVKRVEKICQRMGLSYREIRARNLCANKSDMRP